LKRSIILYPVKVSDYWPAFMHSVTETMSAR